MQNSTWLKCRQAQLNFNFYLYHLSFYACHIHRTENIWGIDKVKALENLTLEGREKRDLNVWFSQAWNEIFFSPFFLPPFYTAHIFLSLSFTLLTQRQEIEEIFSLVDILHHQGLATLAIRLILFALNQHSCV